MVSLGWTVTPRALTLVEGKGSLNHPDENEYNGQRQVCYRWRLPKWLPSDKHENGSDK